MAAFLPRTRVGYVVALIALLLAAPFAVAQQPVRVATYNIKFFSTGVSAERLANLRQVVAALDADIIGLQEIDDRAALQTLFDPGQWDIVIDDDSNENQDVALVVRRPFRARGLDQDLDADDPHFLFPGNANTFGFPDRRDLLCVEVEVPGAAEGLFVMVHHAKARSGGRSATDARRESAARSILSVLEQRFDGRRYVLLGDMNDNPDDASMNILEMGMPAAPAGPEEIAGPFLLNLTEALVAQDRVSWGLKGNAVQNGQVNTVRPGSRHQNNAERGTVGSVSPILFDQILVPVSMAAEYVAGSVTILDDPSGVVGGQNAASDHLPVYADFVIGGTAPPPVPASQVTIVELLPDPTGDDRGREEVVLANSGGSIALTGWRLRDRAGNIHVLSGNLAAQARVTITLPAGVLPLNNDGDEVSLINPGGDIAHHVSYGASQATAGERIAFP